jgi:very-short-patch-repair endonuclease
MARRPPATRPQSPQDGPGATKTPRVDSESGSVLERHLAASVRAHGLPEPEREYRFHATRKWRVDFCWVAERLAVEIEGGIYRGGGHTSVNGIKRDVDKSNALTLAGWRLLRFHGDQVKSGEAVELIRQALAHDGREV